ncbi:hypothetical protein AAZX31_03G085000 [Glycine max]|uniref:probable LRR receptor-like serine/threonine-protein kinase At3g47570 n=1 Tax=Glycine max TaxID=3847 RepID=UPI0003DEC012|nr:probable LRR receptor-like serine/threonine-protein kinase At3g47570 [Glycine max]XP_028224895.1 probable LRR receptor-like serine/threonine-protein kinase At3g47570 [Glycine soja]KAH1069276.1 hypothetical protein GYH30_006757 [Glycine max]KRH66285.2 hypothetical protein GLYMA_03G096600v4 [Glycine max]|eukprot:XP_006577603.1 probable LRR receptor-like serine/threonine-protein kinase At3g47570 [Glycine max]
MKYFSFMLLAFSSIHAHLFSLFALNSLWSTFALGNETDQLALLKFRESISTDPYGIFLSWNNSAHFCNWHGIICNPTLQRVTELNLLGYKLKGTISPHVGNLSYMRSLDLGNNSFYGKIPQELGQLSRLQILYVDNNTLVGKIPTNLASCTRLKVLDLGGNNLIGKIPMKFGSLQKLQQLVLSKNRLIGGIPSFIGNFSSLTDLWVGDNNLEGHIPQEMCSLKSLTNVYVSNNKLSGTFPSCLYNMSSLSLISATNNQFNGSLPPNMFYTLPNLQELYIGGNQISGPIPPSITNASILTELDIGGNHFMGQVPRLGKLQDLQYLSLTFNNLGDNSSNDLEFLESLTNCSKLQILVISYNNFGGHLPNSLGNLSTQLSELYLGGNQISGEIPEELGNLLIGLILLTMENNNIGGIIPTTFGMFQKMQLLDLSANKLLGEIGAFVGNLSQLFYLAMGANMFERNIPPSIGNCQMLQYLNLSQNNLIGTIPIEIFNLSSLTNSLDLSQNSLSGSILEEVGNLKNLNWLGMYENHLSGDIPGTIGECIMLEYLYLDGNSLQGNIPSSLASLKSLRYLDLSRNRLSGSIPNVLQNIFVLEYLNVSFNMLDGDVPTEGVFRNASTFVVTGNNKLCGGISELHLPPCPVIQGKKLAKHHKFRLIAVMVSVVAFLLILLIILTIYWMRRSKKASLDSPTFDLLAKVSYQSLHNGTDGFSTANLIGSGNFSSVYKGTLELENNVVAIKVLNLKRKGAHKSFIAECNALKNIKHRNLVQILTCCSSTDYKGQEFKALIFEYMKNGSLEQWLHPRALSQEHLRALNLDQRLNIMIDIASALNYLHHECEQSVVHCDLKPSNVLLDDDMIAHVSDFGIARLISTINGTTSKKTSTIGIKGTVGYAPPEYGVGSEVSTYGDVYSFGIILLEMLTGRRPTDEMFEDGQNIHNFVAISFPDNLLQILDPRLIPTNEATLEGNNWKKCLISLFRIGLACSMESPKERMDMVDLTRELNQIRKAFLVGVNL